MSEPHARLGHPGEARTGSIMPAMPRRPPMILWRHLLLEQWKLIGLTTLIVVTVISFAATINPLADGKLAASDVPKFMLLAIPPMLAYAVPFAAGFGATLAHHRLVQDNEMLAAHAGGISHRAMLVPATVTGLMLSGGLLVMNEQVIPSFLRSMERMITRDVARMLTRSVEVGEPLLIEDMAIYADHAWPLGPDAEVGAYERIHLKGLAALGLDERPGAASADAPPPLEVDMELTASQAVVYMFHAKSRSDREGAEPGRVEGGTEIIVQLINAYGSNKRNIPMATGAQGVLGPLWVPGTFSNDPKFLTWAELNSALEHPERMTWVQAVKRDLAWAVMKIESVQNARGVLRETGRLSLRQPRGERLVVSGRTGRVRGDRLGIVPTPGQSRVRVETFTRDEGGALVPRTRLLADGAELVPEPPEPGGTATPTFSLSLTEVSLETSERDAPAVGVDDRSFSSLELLASRREENLLRAPVGTVLAEADRLLERIGENQWLRSVREKLVETLGSFEREVISKRHERLAMSLSALVMVLIGAIMAMRLRHSPPLIAYLWSFFPALASSLTISGGQQFVYKFGPSGLALLWGGLAGLGLLTLCAYRGLARH